MFFNASPPFFIVFPLLFNAIRCSLTPAYRPSTHSNRHLTPLCHPLTLTHPLLFPLHRILDNDITIFTPFCRLLMPRCRALALPRRSFASPLPFNFSLSPFIVSLSPFNASVMPFDAFSLPFNAFSLPFNASRHT